MNFYDCNPYYDSLMIGNVFILMFAFEIKFCLYNQSGFDPSAPLIAHFISPSLPLIHTLDNILPKDEKGGRRGTLWIVQYGIESRDSNEL
jgi:hypothetical protein